MKYIDMTYATFLEYEKPSIFTCSRRMLPGKPRLQHGRPKQTFPRTKHGLDALVSVGWAFQKAIRECIKSWTWWWPKRSQGLHLGVFQGPISKKHFETCMSISRRIQGEELSQIPAAALTKSIQQYGLCAYSLMYAASILAFFNFILI